MTKITSNPVFLDENFKNNPAPEKAVNFTGFNPVDALPNLAQGIQSAGLVAEFLIQDTLGLNFTRTGVGLNRNKEKLGHLNYNAAKEEFLREGTAGPSMFLIPMGFLYIAKKLWGKALNIQFPLLNRFGNTLEEIVQNKNVNSENLGKNFYRTILQDTLSRHNLGEKADDVINRNTGRLETLEELSNKLSSVKDKVTKKGLKGEFSQVKNQIIEEISNLTQKQGVSVRDPFAVKLEKRGNLSEVNTKISDLIDDSLKYSGDVIKKTKEKLKDSPDKALNYAKKLKNISIGGRAIFTGLTIASIATFLWVNPKLYQRNKNFPGIDGLAGENTGNKNNKTDKTNASTLFERLNKTGGVKNENRQ